MLEWKASNCVFIDCPVTGMKNIHLSLPYDPFKRSPQLQVLKFYYSVTHLCLDNFSSEHRCKYLWAMDENLKGKTEGKLMIKLFFTPLQACPFVIDIYAEKCKPRIKAIYLEAGSWQLNRAICKSVVNKGDAKVMDGCENIIVYTYRMGMRITSVIENKVWHDTSVRYFVLISMIVALLPCVLHFWELHFLIASYYI